MLLNKLLKAIQPVQVTGESDIEITGINIDSRLVEAGQLFMAMRGTQADGHAYIPTAIEKGAVAVLCEDMPEEPVAGITYIQVKDSEDATGKIATTFYGDPTSKMELVGVTGTNGKTTTVTLIYEILKAAGRKAHICGNYGIPYCEVVLNEHLYEEEGHDVVVEMSNFQLIDIEEFKPEVATVLNLTPDHLDYMDSLDEYYASKMRIYMNQDENDLFINNSDDETLQSYLAQYPVPSHIETFSVKSLADVELKDNAIYYKGQKVISRDEIKIVGLHNVANMMVAIAACRAVGVSLESIHDTLAAFKGVEHRIEFVRELDGVRYYNDSKGTNTDAAVIAIKAFEKPVILLMGGHEKNLDLKDVREQNPLIKTLICFGETKERFSKDMQHPHTIVVDHMKDAILKAKEIAEEGDVVLLSPSTSSFDEFHSYVERGNVFKDIVNKL